MLEAIESLTDFRLNIAVPWSELIPEHMQQGKVDLVGAVGIRRMDLWLVSVVLLNRISKT
jgi:hypothetical protein